MMIKTRITEENSCFIGVKLGTQSTSVYIHKDDLPLEKGKTIRYAEGIPDTAKFAVIEEMLTKEMPLLDLDGTITTFMNEFLVLYTSNSTDNLLLHNNRSPCNAGKTITNEITVKIREFSKENWKLCHNCKWPIEVEYIEDLLNKP